MRETFVQHCIMRENGRKPQNWKLELSLQITGIDRFAHLLVPAPVLFCKGLEVYYMFPIEDRASGSF